MGFTDIGIKNKLQKASSESTTRLLSKNEFEKDAARKQEEINDLYPKLGKATYEAFEKGEFSSEMKSICEQIKKLEAEIVELNAKSEELKAKEKAEKEANKE